MSGGGLGTSAAAVRLATAGVAAMAAIAPIAAASSAAAMTAPATVEARQSAPERQSSATTPPIPAPALEDAEPPVAEHVQATAARLRAAPTDGAAWGRYGMVLQAHGLDAAAIVAYGEAARRQPAEMRWPYFQAITEQESSPERALALYDRAIALDPTYAAAHIRRGITLRGIGRLDEARTAFAEALRLSPENVSAHIHMGQLQLATGAIDAAVEHLRFARTARPRDATVVSALARALARQGDRDAARRLSAAARGLEPGRIVDDARFAAVVMEARTLQSFITRGEVMLMEGAPARAIAELERGLRVGHDPGAMYSTMARFRYVMRQPAACLAAADAAIEAGREGSEIRQLRIMALLQLDRIDEARDAVRELLARAPEDLAVRRLAARAATAADDHAAALEHLDVVLARERSPEDRRARAATLTALDRHDEAVAALEELVATDRTLETLFALGEARRLAGRSDAAMAAYREAAPMAEDPMPGRRIAALLGERGEWTAAEVMLRGLRERWPDDPSLANDLAWLLATCPNTGIRDGEEAITLVEPLVRFTRRGNAAVLDTLAAALAAAGRHDEAVRTIDEAIALAEAAEGDDSAAADDYRRRRDAYVAGTPWTDRAGASG